MLASHRCGSGSIPGLDAICGLSLLLVLFPAQRGFSPCTPVSPLLKNQYCLILIRSRFRGRIATLWRCHCKFIFLFLPASALMIYQNYERKTNQSQQQAPIFNFSVTPMRQNQFTHSYENAWRSLFYKELRQATLWNSLI